MSASSHAPRPYTRFILVRHGQAEGNRELRYLGATDAPLTETGRDQALRLAPAVRPFALAAIYSSPLARARDTARALAEDCDLPVTPRDDLREMDFGAWEGHTRAAVLAEYPDLLAAWETSAEVAPPGGESLVAVGARVVACADALAAAHPGQTVALVSHVGPIKALVCAALALPPAVAQRMWLDPASICVVDWRPAAGAPTSGSGILRTFNAIGHLDPPSWLAR
ncbi:MAG TPA: histidine phosphatase family protein [Ktedonobacterales bacterium]|nr:histidine phosphatase family protein [Ktedonobacterales bacterium]